MIHISLHTACVCIEGDRLSELPAVFEGLKYELKSQVVTDREHAPDRLMEPTDNINIVRKLAHFSKGWTFILDPEMVIGLEEEFWANYSGSANAQVVCWLCEGISGSYGFAYFSGGEQLRSVLSIDGQIAEEKGSPLPQEQSIDWKNAWEDGVLAIVARFGAVYEFLREQTEYHVYTLDGS